MTILKISGHSDDIVCYELGSTGGDELYPDSKWDDQEGPYQGTLLVHSGKGRCLVHVLYSGCWSFSVSKVDEEDPSPWSATVTWKGYSQILHIDVPKGTKVEWRS